MSVLGRLHAATDEDIRAVHAQPLKMEILYYGELYDTSAIDELDEEEKQDILNYKPQLRPEIFYLERWYHLVNYLLSGETDKNADKFPYNFIYGQRLALGEKGWDIAQGYTSDDVKKIADAINKIDMMALRQRYDVEVLNKKEIYPKGGFPAKMPAEVVDLIGQLVAYINDLSGKGLGFYRVLV